LSDGEKQNITLELTLKNPTLIKRPVLVTKQEVSVGFDKTISGRAFIDKLIPTHAVNKTLQGLSGNRRLTKINKFKINTLGFQKLSCFFGKNDCHFVITTIKNLIGLVLLLAGIIMLVKVMFCFSPSLKLR
jgi:hypothetical protein